MIVREDFNQPVLQMIKYQAVDWPKLDYEYKTSEKDGKHPGFKEQSFEWAEKWL